MESRDHGNQHSAHSTFPTASFAGPSEPVPAVISTRAAAGNHDPACVINLTVPVFEPAKIANWIARPSRGVRDLPFEVGYVRREQ